MLKHDTLKNGTSRIGLDGSPPLRGKKKRENLVFKVTDYKFYENMCSGGEAPEKIFSRHPF